jgi:UDP-glucose 4-epimerase
MPSMRPWADQRVVVTGGASFIGSHLVDKLVTLGANIKVIDNLSSGSLDNLATSLDKIEFIDKDLEYIQKDECKSLFQDQDVVFHLAAVHGGRGFITHHPADVSSNLAIDHHVFEACANTKVKNVVFASTACVYPTKLQEEIGSDYKLKEDDSNPFRLENFLSADIEYGWGKLMSEIQMIAFRKQYGLNGCPVRFVTAYGPRENETHAIIALIYKALEKMDPYEIWGTGQQERDFTYVEDIVNGCIFASDKIFDCTPINLGTGIRHKVLDVVDTIFKIIGWRPESIQFKTSEPVGALSRALDNSRAKAMLGWVPIFSLENGLEKTIDWYKNTHTPRGIVDNQVLVNHVKQ